MNKIILTDADGVLLNWEQAFHRWADKQGYKQLPNTSAEYDIGVRLGVDSETKRNLVRQFNESAHIEHVPPLRDAVHYIKKFHEQHGYVFHCITSLTTDKYAQQLRIRNIQNLFGPTAFQEFIFLDTGADKTDVLQKYNGCDYLWVEDVIKNAEDGADVGLDSIVMQHQYNAHYTDLPVRKNWKGIYEYVYS